MQREGIKVRHRTDEDDVAPVLPTLLTVHKVSDDSYQVLDPRGRLVTTKPSRDEADSFIEGYMVGRVEMVDLLRRQLQPVVNLTER